MRTINKFVFRIVIGIFILVVVIATICHLHIAEKQSGKRTGKLNLIKLHLHSKKVTVRFD